MISGLKEKENAAAAAPKHGGTTNDVLFSTRPWSGLKNPRIVRVPRAFAGKDRHSKVSTIRGLRDRRVRLSVQTALQLYDLQDKLGFNQPSKVVDWLISAAQHEIDKLPPLPFRPESFPHRFCQPPLPTSDEKTSLDNPTIVMAAAGNNLDAFGAGSHRNDKSTAGDEAEDCHLALFSSMANDESSLRSKVPQQLSMFPDFSLSRKLDHVNSIRFGDADYGAAEASANVSNAPSLYQLHSSNLSAYERSNSSNSLSLMPHASQLVLYASGSGTPSMFPPFMTPLSGLHTMQMSHVQGSDSLTFLQSSSPIMVRPNSHPRLS